VDVQFGLVDLLDSNLGTLARHAPQRRPEGSDDVQDWPLTWEDVTRVGRHQPGTFICVATVVATVMTPCATCIRSSRSGKPAGPGRAASMRSLFPNEASDDQNRHHPIWKVPDQGSAVSSQR